MSFSASPRGDTLLDLDARASSLSGLRPSLISTPGPGLPKSSRINPLSGNSWALGRL